MVSFAVACLYILWTKYIKSTCGVGSHAYSCVCVFSTTSLHIVMKHDIGHVHLVLLCFGLCRYNITLNLLETQLALCILLLGAFTVMWSTYCFGMPVHVSTCISTAPTGWNSMTVVIEDFMKIWQNANFVKMWQNIRHFTRRHNYILLLLATLNYHKCSAFEWIGIRLLS